MQIGNKIYIVKTLGGDVIGIYNSQAFARRAVAKTEKHGSECVVVECTIDAIHTKEKN